MQAFKAESKRLLDLMVNSIYTHKEIFLRELISNASDAIDKLNHRALELGTTGISSDEFAINILIDKDNRRLIIKDNGCGMTKDELKNNLGIIAKSGTSEFKAQNEGVNAEIIGQFGVGFYSAFMVADRVEVVSRAFSSDEAYEWASEGSEGFTITKAKKDDHGTEVILRIKQDAEGENYSEFLSTHRLTALIKRYSDYIRYPIIMQVEKSREIEKEDGKKEYEKYTEDETINSMIPLWKRSKQELNDELYAQFYKESFNDYENPLHTIHSSAEGAVSYNALLFFPSRAPFNYYTKDYEKGLSLYSNGVMIMDKCADLVPDCFSFVKGLVDSPDLSLNISRELLQHDRQLKIIAANIEKKIKSELINLLTSKRDDYVKLWQAFGLQIKYGIYSSYGQSRELLEDLLLFFSMKQDKLITLKEYLDSMPESEQFIYYASGTDSSSASALPQLELLKEKNLDALLLNEDVDEFVLQMLNEYKGKSFKSVTGSDFDLSTDEQKEKLTQSEKEYESLLEDVKAALSGEITQVKLSPLPKNHPVSMSAQGPISIEMEKILNAMPGENKVKAERVLELNPEHPVFEMLLNSTGKKREAYAKILFAQAQMLRGKAPEKPEAYFESIMTLLS